MLPDWQVPPVGIHAVYASRSHLAPKVRSFIDFLVEAFAAGAGTQAAGSASRR